MSQPIVSSMRSVQQNLLHLEVAPRMLLREAALLEQDIAAIEAEPEETTGIMIYAHQADPDHIRVTLPLHETAICPGCGEANPYTCDECGACMCEEPTCQPVHFSSCSARQVLP